MTRQIRTLGVLGVGLAALMSASLAQGQQKYSYNHSTPPQSSRYVQQHIIDVGDVPGHEIRMLEVQRKYTRDHPMIRGTRVLETCTRGFSDYISGAGPARGYDVWLLEDGNKVYVEWRGTTYAEPTVTGSIRGTYNGTSQLTGGTGKFATIRGVFTTTSEFDSDPDTGYNTSSSRGEYWFDE